MKYLYGLIALLGVVGAYIMLHHATSTAETDAVAVDNITAISGTWSIDVLKERTDPGLISAMSSQGQSAEELLKIYSVLGKLTKPAECKVHNTGETIKNKEHHVTISYDCEAEYEKGPAVVSLTLIKADSQKKWLIYYINIRSDALGGDVIE